jgi:hypothetical protein
VTDPEWQDSEISTARVLAWVAGIGLLLFAALMFVFAGVMSQEGWDETNQLQETIGIVATLCLFISAIIAFVYAATGRATGVFIVACVADAALIATWFVGLSTWCSSCGAP